MGTHRVSDPTSVLGTEYRDRVATGLSVAAVLMALAILIGWAAR